jgi:hypothetical protein
VKLPASTNLPFTLLGDSELLPTLLARYALSAGYGLSEVECINDDGRFCARNLMAVAEFPKAFLPTTRGKQQRSAQISLPKAMVGGKSRCGRSQGGLSDKRTADRRILRKAQMTDRPLSSAAITRSDAIDVFAQSVG